MKRGAEDYPEEESDCYNSKRKKKINLVDREDDLESSGRMNLNEDLLYEVLKHVDARTLGRSACVSRTWRTIARDERLWELICTRQWANIPNNDDRQLRSVVLALGGFRRLHSLYLWPLSKPQSSSSPAPAASSWPSFGPTMGSISKPPAKWGKDEVHLSLSLLSIRFYEKMNFASRGR